MKKSQEMETPFSSVGNTSKMSETPHEWNPLTGPRIFKTANQAWERYGQFRFGIGQRTFLTYVGKEKECTPRDDGKYHVEDIELLSKSRGWPPSPAFMMMARLDPLEKGKKLEDDYGALFQKEKALTQEMIRRNKELELKRREKKLIPRHLYEQQLAAAAVIVCTGAEAFVHENVREIIHLAGGSLDNEQTVREFMLSKVNAFLHGFSNVKAYEVELEEALDAEFEEEALKGAMPEEEEA